MSDTIKPTTWEIATKMLRAYDDETGEFDADAWNSLHLDLGDKAQAIHAVISRMNSEETACRQEAARLSKRARSRANAARRLRGYLADCMQAAGLPEINTPTLNVRSSPPRPSVDVVDVGALPERFVRLTPAPDKRAILDALTSGEDVAGATLVTPPHNTITFR